MASLSDLIVGEQPTWMDKIRGFMMQNPTAIIDPLGTIGRHAVEAWDARTPQTIYGQEPMQAMIPTKENIAAFLTKAMQSKVPANVLKNHPEIGTAMALAEARYPMHMQNVNKFGGRISIEPPSLKDNYAGWFRPSDSVVSVVEKPAQSKGSTYYRVRDYMNTLLHEAAHSDQFNRESSRFDKSELLAPNKGGTYITPEASKKLVGNDSLYRNQPIEADAFRRGDIAEKTVRKVLDLLPSREFDRIPFSGVAENVQEDMQRLSSYFNQAIKTVAKMPLSERVSEATKARNIFELKSIKNTKLNEMKLLADRGVDIANVTGKPYKYDQMFTDTAVFDPSVFIDRQNVANAVKQRMVPDSHKSLQDLNLENLTHQLQDAKRVSPLYEWLRKSLGIEKAAGQLTHDQWLESLQRIYPK